MQDSWRRAISTGVQAGIPLPCFTTALSFYDGYRHDTLPANLIQVRLGEGSTAAGPGGRSLRVGPACWGLGAGAYGLGLGAGLRVVLTSLASRSQAQRDYFGAHTYELLASPGKFIHTNWTGHGGSVSSSSYNA